MPKLGDFPQGVKHQIQEAQVTSQIIRIGLNPYCQSFTPTNDSVDPNKQNATIPPNSIDEELDQWEDCPNEWGPTPIHLRLNYKKNTRRVVSCKRGFYSYRKGYNQYNTRLRDNPLLKDWEKCHSIDHTYLLPMTYNDTQRDPDVLSWNKAMKSEIDSLEDMHVWEVIDRPENVKVMNSKWVFTKKFNKDGSLQKFKARFVACGNSARPLVDFGEISSPVIRTSTLRLLFALTAMRRYSFRTADIRCAYLYGEIDREIFLKPPGGYIKNQGGKPKVCKLLKALYGLRQAGRACFLKLKEILLLCGFEQSK